ERVLADHHLDPQVAAGPAEFARLALAAVLDRHPALDPGRDVHLEVHDGRDTAGSPAPGTRVGHADAFAAAGRAGGGHLEEAARLDDLPLAAAVVARRRDRPLARARALALAAMFLPIDVDR